MNSYAFNLIRTVAINEKQKLSTRGTKFFLSSKKWISQKPFRVEAYNSRV